MLRANTALDVICMHLTSERARERGDALSRLQEIVKDRPKTFSKDTWNRLFQAYFSMLSIEVKYYMKGGPKGGSKGELRGEESKGESKRELRGESTSSDTKEGSALSALSTLSTLSTLPTLPTLSHSMQKLQRLFRDANTLFMSLASLYPSYSMVISLDGILDSIIGFLGQFCHSELYIDILRLLNCILGHDGYLYAISTKHAQTFLDNILTTLSAPFQVHPLARHELLRLSVVISRYFEEYNDLEALKGLLNQTLVALLKEDVEPTPKYLLETFQTCLRSLKDTYPIFCRSIFSKFATKFCTSQYTKKATILDMIIKICWISSSCIQVDRELCMYISNYLCDGSVFIRQKLSLLNPLSLLKDTVEDLEASEITRSTEAMYLRALAEYCTLDACDNVSNTGLSLSVVITFAKFLYCPDDNVEMDQLYSILERCSSEDSVWLMSTFSMSSWNTKIPDQVLEFAQHCISRPNQSSAAIRLLSTAINHQRALLPSLPRQIILCELSEELLELVTLHYHRRYGRVLWSKTAIREFRNLMTSIVSYLTRRLDTKLWTLRFLALAEKISKFFAILKSMKSSADGTWWVEYVNITRNSMALINEYVPELDVDQVRFVLSSKWSIDIVSIDDPLSCIKSVLHFLESALSYDATVSIAHDQIFKSYISTRWAWNIIKHHCHCWSEFQRMQGDQILSACVDSLLLKARRDQARDLLEIPSKSETCDSIKSGLLMIIEIYALISNYQDKDGELEQVIDDCGEFIFDRLVSSSLPVEDIQAICSVLPILPACLSEKGREVVDSIHGRCRSTQLLELCNILASKWTVTSGSFFNKMLNLIDSFDSPFTSYPTRIELIKLARRLNKKILGHQSVALEVTKPGCKIDPELSKDAAHESMLRILKGEQDVRKSIVHVNNVLVSYPDLEVYKVPEVYDTINRFIPQHCMDGVYCFLKTSSVEVCHFFVDQKSSSSIQCAEICLFWKALQPDFINVMISSSMNPENVFAVFVARALLGHFQGMKEISSRLLRFVKDSLHQSGFEKLFKSEIFRIIAFILLMSFELALEPSVLQDCLNHVFGTMKTSVNDFFHSVCGGLLLLEIAHICDNDVLLASCAFSTMKYVLGNLLTLHRPICEKLVQWITPFVAVPSLSENASSVISSLKLLIVDQYIEEESKECTDIDSSSMVVGILQDLIDHFPQLPIKACNLVLKVGISVIKDLSDSKVPSKLRFLCIRDEGRLVKLCSIDLNSGDTNYQTLENDHKFPWFKEIVREAELRPYLCIFRKFPELLSACTAYLVALYLRVKPFSISNLDQVDLVIISEGIKIYQVYYNGRSHPYQLCQTLRLGSHVHELFWLEVMEAETKDLSRYCTVFSNLHEEDYKDFTLLYRPISSLKSGTCNADILDESLFGDSLLMSQRWSCEDIPQDFDATRMVNEMYCTLREYILNPRVNSPWYDGDDQFIRLACLCAQATIDKEKCEDLIKYSLRMFTDTKKDHNGLVIMRQVLTNCWENLGCPDVKVIADVCEATALWHSDQQERAVHCMRQAAEYIDRAPLIFREVETTALLKGAKYTWKLRCGTFAQIRKKFIDKICFSDNESSRLYPKVHDLIAQFHDEQYQSTLKAGLIQTRRKLLETLRNELKSAPPNSDYVKGIERHLRQDELELERLIADKRHYAVHAAINYMKAITQGDRYDLKVFRLVSLWLSFRKLLPMNDVFNGEFPAYKFIPVMYQIASRLDSSDSCVLFQERLQLLLQRILSDHPYHCLPHLLALRRNANTMTAGTKRRLVTGSSPQERRALAAEQLISTGKCQKPYLREIIGDTEKLWQAYLEMATTELSPGTSTKVIHPFESRWSVKKIRNLKAAVITRNIPVSPSGIYDDAVKVDMFCHDGYRVVGGINIPKIVDCQGSDGLHYRQLVKGKDDVRQDAVMEQVFCLLNRILAESSETQRRNLSLRTYRVVPLMPLAGVLEWVNNATPIGDYLTIAHQKINPQDITPKEARSIMKGEFERTDSNPLSKQKTFIESICSKFNPVFRYFFLESTLSVQGWFQMRLKYTRSTAVGSMIGYVVGLGDRHCQNIMIDRLSGELIHIDLNMIFELGKHLRIPETVPFRLTRDIVDGLGYAGLEAGFSSNATQVMTVLRTKMEIIIMLMEAFKHDPLQRWSLNAGAEQSGELDLDEDEASSASTKDADRALLRIREKLIGIEDGTILSERGQVLFLIQMATNEELLAQMYHGWQPWM